MNLKLNDEGDLIIDKGAVRCSGNEFIAQVIKTRFKTILGEWQLNLSVGLPWFDRLLGRNYSLDEIYAWAYKVLQETEGVQRVVAVQVMVLPERKARILFEVATMYGALRNSVEV